MSATEPMSSSESAAIRMATEVAVRVIAEAMAKVIESDPHQWSPRPCQTCLAVSGLLGRSFGCDKKGGR